MSAWPKCGEPWCSKEALQGFVMYPFFVAFWSCFIINKLFLFTKNYSGQFFLQKFFDSGKASQALGSVCKVQGKGQPPPKKWARSLCGLADRLFLSLVEPQGDVGSHQGERKT